MSLFARAFRQTAAGEPEQVAVLFSGAGGKTGGMLDAYNLTGRRASGLAINHDDAAISSHAASFPDLRPMKADLWSIDNPRSLIPGGRLDLLAASPECTNHSKAAAGKPRDDQSRNTMQQVLHWCMTTQTRRVLVENVTEATQWGPLDEQGKPIKELKGMYFNAWWQQLIAIGYTNLSMRRIRMADHGDATLRERLIVMGSLDGSAIVWPKATHGPDSVLGLPYRGMRECVSWDIKGQTVGAKKRAGYRGFHQVNKKHGGVERLMAIEAGLQKFGGEPFVLRRNQHDNSPESNAKSIDAPLHTVTCGGTDIALIVPQRDKTVEGCLHRMLLPIELARANSLEGLELYGDDATQVQLIGNAVPRRGARACFTTLLDPSFSDYARLAA